MQQDLRDSRSILASRTSNINFNKATCVLMALAIDSVVRGVHNVKKLCTRFGIFTDSLKIQGFTQESRDSLEI